MTAPETLVLCFGLDPPLHLQICRVGVCDAAAQVIEDLVVFSGSSLTVSERLWQFNGFWRRIKRISY